MPKLDITSQERSALRAAAHPLRPVVLIGDRGLSDSVLKEIDLNLTAHSLIKIRIGGQERPERDLMLDTICDSLSCAPIHHLGKTLIIYRPGDAAAPVLASETSVTRAQRKPSAPYTPKKQAASGVTRTRRVEKAERAAKKKAKNQNTGSGMSSGRASRPAAANSPAHGIPRRGGSALSLRAGNRRTTHRGDN